MIGYHVSMMYDTSRCLNNGASFKNAYSRDALIMHQLNCCNINNVYSILITYLLPIFFFFNSAVLSKNPLSIET